MMGKVTLQERKVTSHHGKDRSLDGEPLSCLDLFCLGLGWDVLD